MDIESCISIQILSVTRENIYTNPARESIRPKGVCFSPRASFRLREALPPNGEINFDCFMTQSLSGRTVPTTLPHYAISGLMLAEAGKCKKHATSHHYTSPFLGHREWRAGGLFHCRPFFSTNLNINEIYIITLLQPIKLSSTRYVLILLECSFAAVAGGGLVYHPWTTSVVRFLLCFNCSVALAIKTTLNYCSGRCTGSLLDHFQVELPTAA